MNDEIDFTSKRYWVTAPSAVLGHEPGSDFEASLPPDQEAFYLAGGHLSTEPPVEEAEEQEETPSRTGTPRGAKPTPEGDKE